MFKITEDPTYDEDGMELDTEACPRAWLEVVPPATPEELEEILGTL